MPLHEVPPADLFPGRVHRAVPYLYSEEEISALMAASASLRFELRQATYRTLIGLLSVTGMRAGEAIRLDNDDLDLRHGVLTVRNTKFGKSRELPLHHSTIGSLRAYLRVRDLHQPTRVSNAVLISPAGTRLLYCNVSHTFIQLVQRAGLRPRSSALPSDVARACATASLCARCSSGIAPAWRSSRGCRCSPPTSGTFTPRTPTGI